MVDMVSREKVIDYCDLCSDKAVLEYIRDVDIYACSICSQSYKDNIKNSFIRRKSYRREMEEVLYDSNEIEY